MATQGDETFVQIEKLKDNETYPVWKFQITIVLKSMGLYEICDEASPSLYILLLLAPR